MQNERASLTILAICCVLALSLALGTHLWGQSGTSGLPSPPPAASIRPVTDDYYGTKITDPYRYMENFKDPQVQAWMKAQDDYTRAMLAGIPGRTGLLMRIRELDQTVPRVQAFPLPGNVFLISKRLPTEDLFKLYVRRGLAGDDHVRGGH